MSSRHVGAVVCMFVLAAFALPTAAQASTASGYPEFYKSGKLVGTERVPIFGYGHMTLKAPGITTELECVNLLFGSVWNEGSPLRGHLQFLEWWAMGHASFGEYKETSSRCRFVFEGGGAGEEAWVTAERPLTYTEEELTLSNGEKKSYIAEISRPPITLPWNGELVAKAGSAYAKIGIPTGTGTCTELPAAKGCMRLAILYPAIGIQIPLEGSLEVAMANGAKNGLSPSNFEFEGEKSGALVMAGTGDLFYVSGPVKFLGTEGRELVTVK